MAIDIKNVKGVTQVTIDDEMTIYTALAQKTQLQDLLKPGQKLQINLAGVSEIDSAGLQVLMFLKQEAARHDIPLILTQHSQSVVEVLELVDLATHFGDPIVITADRKAS